MKSGLKVIKITDRLYIGDEFDCRAGENKLAVIHACKTPCYTRWADKIRGLKNSQRLVLKDDQNLYLNIVDSHKPLFMHFTFTSFLQFTQKHLQDIILIHCNKGQSRSPALATLFLSKVRREISNNSFSNAFKDFQKLTGHIYGWRGIHRFLEGNWKYFDKFS